MMFDTYRIQSTGQRIPIRLFLTNESGYILEISMYKEISDERTGQIMFHSYGTKQVRSLGSVHIERVTLRLRLQVTHRR